MRNINRFTGKKILITGGCGFIGSHLAEELVKKNEVKVIDNLVSGSLSNIQKFKDNIDFVNKDIRGDIKNEFDNVDVVFHEAAQVFINKSIENPHFDADVNILGTLNVLEACRKKDVPKIVFASSSSVYGEPVTLPIKESHPLNPVTPYGLSKKVCEEYLEIYSSLYDIKSVALRYFNVYGKNQNPDLPNAGVIALFVSHVAKNEPVPIFGDGKFTRDFIDVSDVVRINILSAMCNQDFAAINVGTGRETSLNELVETLESIVNNPIKVVHLPEREGDISRSVADIKASQEIVQFTPQITLEDGLSRLLREVSP